MSEEQPSRGWCANTGSGWQDERRIFEMTRKDVINNIMVNYGPYGVDIEIIEEQIKSGEAQGFSYQTLYTG